MLTCLFAVCAAPLAVVSAGEVEEGFKALSDGKTFDGWKINENPGSWTIEDGAFVAHGERSHLFYTGDAEPFKNFVFKVDAMTAPASNGGVYFHTKYQDTGWPKYGFEAQVNATHKDPKKTGSLYAVKNTEEAAHKDDEYFTYTITVKDKHITFQVNDKTVLEYDEPADAVAGKDFTRVLDSGTFAFQCHDPVSKVFFKNPRVKRLP
jgi:hypothetical protein